MAEPLREDRFLREALPLVASYLSGESVSLEGIPVWAGENPDDESLRFAAQIRLRHALACCEALIPLIGRIEINSSNSHRTIRDETRGVIRGRLDIPRYVARRATNLSWPKTYPILVSEDTPTTPENLLVVSVFRQLLSRLTTTELPPKSAEALAARRHRQWLTRRLTQDPWREIRGAASSQRLRLETERRIARRQTGNDRAYSDFLKFIDEWRLLGTQVAGAPSLEQINRAVLAFPHDQSFSDRIYEIWCMREVAICLEDLGAVMNLEPKPLHRNRHDPIYLFVYGAYKVEIWFQHALPTKAARWKYLGKDAFRGLPDITLVANGQHYLLVDAKNRIAKRKTRSEETYKMLGYFENFASIMSHETNWAVLAFTTDGNFYNRLISDNGNRLELLAAHVQEPELCQFRFRLMELLRNWLDAIALSDQA